MVNIGKILHGKLLQKMVNIGTCAVKKMVA